MGSQTIQIYDSGRILEFGYNDLLTAHGGEMPGGVALVFKMMSHVFADIAKEIPVRGSCFFYSGLGDKGKGIIDGADFVMQVRKNNRLFLDLFHCEDKDAPPAPGGGKYYFELGFNQKCFAVSVQKNIITPEFFDFSKYIHLKRMQSEIISADEIKHLQELRLQLSQAIMKTKASRLFTVKQI